MRLNIDMHTAIFVNSNLRKNMKAKICGWKSIDGGLTPPSGIV